MPSTKSSHKPDLNTGRQWRFEAIGTQWRIDVYDAVPAAAAAVLQDAVRERIALFDRNYSRFRADSLVMRMAHHAGSYTLPTDAEPLFDLYHRLYVLTNGLVTPLVGQLLADAGYDASYSFQTGTLHRPPAWDDALAYHFPRLEIKKPALLDFGAAGKGYLIDIIGELLRAHGIRAFTIDAGGDILHHAPGRPLQVGLENPDDTSQAIGIATVVAQSLCGSAGNRRAWGTFHHIIDPQLLTSPRHISAVWVTARTAMLADALATCLYFVPAHSLAEQFEFEYAIVCPDHSLETSKHFPADFFTERERAHAAHN